MLHILDMIKFPTKKSYIKDSFYKEYVEKLNFTLSSLDYKSVSLISDLLKKMIIKKKKYICMW